MPIAALHKEAAVANQRVSVILPCYNEEATIGSTVTSLPCGAAERDHL